MVQFRGGDPNVAIPWVGFSRVVMACPFPGGGRETQKLNDTLYITYIVPFNFCVTHPPPRESRGVK